MMDALEAGANALATGSILLAARNSVHTWWTGILGCALFAWVFFHAQLYADVTLQVFFVASSACGWWHWLRGQAGHAAPMGYLERGEGGKAFGIALVVTAAYGALLHALTDAYAPFADSAVLAFSVIAQLLMIRRRIETWPFWLLVNTIAVPLYCSRGLYLTALLYACYWVNALVAWRAWQRGLRRLDHLTYARGL
ncbi:MAG: nicotinamide riboside transporter PnuC, partial [Gammaproteobacteria bacterium]